MSIREQLWDEIMLRCAKRGKMHSTLIRFIGHSLGGALATLAAVDFNFNADQRSANNYKPSLCDSVLHIRCRSFGSPHVGNQEFVDLFNIEIRNSYRYAIKMDAVPLVLGLRPGLPRGLVKQSSPVRAHG